MIFDGRRRRFCVLVIVAPREKPRLPGTSEVEIGCRKPAQRSFGEYCGFSRDPLDNYGVV